MDSDIVEVRAPSDPAQQVEIWTDGGCKPNPGPGGWGAILIFRGVEREMSGFDRTTTNNRMELTAAAEALAALKRPCQVRLYTDSEYLKNGITRWHQGWVRRNWRGARGEPVKNMDLWQRIIDLCKTHDVEWHWVRSHVGIGLNERADKLATAAREDGLAAAEPRPRGVTRSPRSA
jgi:ribonuclease HI